MSFDSVVKQPFLSKLTNFLGEFDFTQIHYRFQQWIQLLLKQEAVESNLDLLVIVIGEFSNENLHFLREIILFSSTKCPQGGFSINLKSTGFKISSKQRWKLKGNGGHMEMWRPSTGQEIRARCGGFCARCQPTHANTIQLEFNDL